MTQENVTQDEAHGNKVALSAACLQIIDDETPRVRDVDLGTALGFDRPRDVRKIIERNSPELSMYGPLRHRGAKVGIGSGASRQVFEYWLTEEQALLVTMFSRTSRAAEARQEIIRVFTDYRRGLLVRPVHVRAHQRSAPRRFDKVRPGRAWAEFPMMDYKQWSDVAMLALGALALENEEQAEAVAAIVKPWTRDRDFVLTSVRYAAFYERFQAEAQKRLN